MASRLQELDVRNRLSCLLNHAQVGIDAVYLRSELEGQKAAALARWAVEIEKIVGSKYSLTV